MKKALLLAAACLVSLALGELLTRLLLPPPQEVQVLSAAGPPREGSEKDPSTLFRLTSGGYRLRPSTTVELRNHRLSGKDVRIETNSLGYRGPELGPERGTRVLFLGDSITFGDWLAEDETFVSRVEALARAEGKEIETINAGVGGIGLGDELAILTETGLSTEPDVVVVGFYLNDALPSPGVRVVEVPDFLGWSRLARHVAAVATSLSPPVEPEEVPRVPRETQRRWRLQTQERYPAGPGPPRHDPKAFNRLMQKHFADWGMAWSDGAWESLRPLFAELVRLSEENGFRLLVVAFPVRYQVEADFLRAEPQQRLHELGAELGFPVLDVLPLLRDAYRASPEIRLFYDHCHPTEHANALLADAIWGFLEENGAGEG